MTPASILDESLARVALALRDRDVSALELVEEAVRRHETYGETLQAYKLFDAEGARAGARHADEMMEAARPVAIPRSMRHLRCAASRCR